MSRRFWPICEPAQADYEQLREIVLAGGDVGEMLATRRFARRGLAGLISWPSAEPAYLGPVIGACRPPWCGVRIRASGRCVTPMRSCSTSVLKVTRCGR